jgi:hypothetical protein
MTRFIRSGRIGGSRPETQRCVPGMTMAAAVAVLAMDGAGS